MGVVVCPGSAQPVRHAVFTCSCRALGITNQTDLFTTIRKALQLR
ncbi:hypothetical protein [Streptomyces piniterrae]|nr:hypothetical protein [Streptomyces piniterrae]